MLLPDTDDAKAFKLFTSTVEPTKGASANLQNNHIGLGIYLEVV
jgi:hypothetical protein